MENPNPPVSVANPMIQEVFDHLARALLAIRQGEKGVPDLLSLHVRYAPSIYRLLGSNGIPEQELPSDTPPVLVSAVFVRLDDRNLLRLSLGKIDGSLPLFFHFCGAPGPAPVFFDGTGEG